MEWRSHYSATCQPPRIGAPLLLPPQQLPPPGQGQLCDHDNTVMYTSLIVALPECANCLTQAKHNGMKLNKAEILPPFEFVFILQSRSSLKITLPCIIYYQLSQCYWWCFHLVTLCACHHGKTWTPSLVGADTEAIQSILAVFFLQVVLCKI